MVMHSLVVFVGGLVVALVLVAMMLEFLGSKKK
jgi:hypothetical protein